MKGLIFLLLFVTAIAYGQKAIIDESQEPTVPVTTQEEYNYATKGYKLDIETGRDIKKGYTVTDIPNPYYSHQNYSFNFKYLIRESTNEIAAILVIAKSNIWGNVYHICIPNYTSSIYYQQYLNSIIAWDKTMLSEYYRAYGLLTHKQFFKQ